MQKTFINFNQPQFSTSATKNSKNDKKLQFFWASIFSKTKYHFNQRGARFFSPDENRIFY